MNNVFQSPARISRILTATPNHHVASSRWLCTQPAQRASASGPSSPLRILRVPQEARQSSRATIAFGSNLGDRVHHIESALRLMSKHGISVLKTSPLYETAAMYYEDQGRFINGVCRIRTDKDPLALLDCLQAIEQSLGRERLVEKGPRTIDLDILMYSEQQMDTPRLVIPHPGIREREFVLRPLNDIQHSDRVPVKKGITWSTTSVEKLYNRLPDRDQSMSPVTQVSSNLPLIRSEDPSRSTMIMAILNLTPDSFSDGGVHNSTDTTALSETVRSYVAAGATIIDVGGQSSRPGAKQLSASEELERILPAIRTIRKMPEGKSVAISVDTFLPAVAKEALAAGADIINDISGGTMSNGEMLSVVAEANKTIVLMHMRGDPQTMNSHANYPKGVVSEVGKELAQRVIEAEDAGIPRWRIILDPGIGFAKKMQHNLLLLQNLSTLRAHPDLAGLPWLLGTSRKKFIGTITGVDEAAKRVMGTAATITSSIAGGADIVRVHDVARMAEVVKMSDAIYRPSQ